MLVRKDLFNQLLDLANVSVEYLNAKDKDIKWITVKGNHIPIKKGQSQDEAVKAFLSKVESKSSKKVADKTQTKEFKEWFKGSKVVNKKGEPLVVYHGTNAKFDEFEDQQRGRKILGDGFYFTPSYDLAKSHAERKDGKNIMELYLDIEKPLKLTWEQARQKMYKKEQLRELGYDGMIIKTEDSDTIFVAISSNQIKSVNNKGTFSKDSNNINE